MQTHSRKAHPVRTWLVLCVPLVAIDVWLGSIGAGFGGVRVAGGVLAALALAAFVTWFACWRLLGVASWVVAWLLYVAAVVVTVLDALAWWFQGSGFSVRFFANVRLDNLRSGMHAFPMLAAVVAVVVVAALLLSAWVLYRVARPGAGRRPALAMRAAALVGLLVVTGVVPSAWQRLGTFAAHFDRGQPASVALPAADLRLLANPDPVPRDAVRARPGKNLVIIYMESLERIYTDDKIFPGLTPNLNYWRARGLDYSDYLTYAGADYTIAGLFASQCGAPYLPSPVRALELSGNNANATSFQPTLACLGDVLHAAGYDQVFMNGVDLSFAGDGTFFDLHGFNQVLGLKQLEKAGGGNLPHPGWGLYDRDLFHIAAAKFEKLASAGRPFNLDVLTIDNHPPHGRPSPGCPKYTANNNDVLQAVHCTDDLVGKFLDTISRNPAWKNTVVVVMSDHQSMRNDAWPLYPKWYKRRPLLFILNGGQGRRDMRFYHMDIAPTVLHLMGVKTNATFLAGADRSAANAPGSPLVNDAADVAVLRKALWARVQPLELCKQDVLVGASDNGVRLGGYAVPMSWRGRRAVGLNSDDAWMVWISSNSVNGSVSDDGVDVAPLLAGRAAGASEPASSALNFLPSTTLERVPGESGLLVLPMAGSQPLKQFAVDWVGKDGGITRIAEVPRLRDLEIRAPHCGALLAQMNRLPAGRAENLSTDFTTTTAPLYPPLPANLRFDNDGVLPYTREFGWQSPEVWGSFSDGRSARLGFTLPKAHCHGGEYDFKVHPFLVDSRPRLDVAVYANGALMTTWNFAKDMAHEGTWWNVTAPIRTPDAQCRVDLRFVFHRPGAAPPPYPKGEDPRPLQLLFLSMQPAGGTAGGTADR